MKVLYCSHTADLKGSAISIHQLITGIGAKGFQPAAVFSKNGPLAEELRKRDIPAYVLKRRGFLGLGLIREALDVIRRERPAIVHLNSAVPFCKYVAIAARIKRLPIIWHVREDPEGKRVRKLKKWINLLSDRVLVVSTDLEEFFRPGGKVSKVYNGVDAEKFRPDISGSRFRNKYGIPEAAFVFGMVGTIEERKGYMLFLKAAEALPQDESVRFLIVGSGSPEDEKKVRDFLKERPGLSDQVILTGRLSDMPEVMAGIDVLVMPSLWEGFPRALIEAMAAGRPAIATDVGEVRYIIEDGSTGFIIRKGDAAGLEERMSACIGMGDGLKEMGRLARESVYRFSVQAHIQNVAFKYEEVLADRRAV